MGQLTTGERQFACVILVVLMILGITMSVAGRFDPMGVHGTMVFLYSGALFWWIVTTFFGKEPDASRFACYYDDPIKVGIALTMVWAVFGMFMGVWVAAQLAWPDLAFDTGMVKLWPATPAHTTGVIFGFGGNALIATSFHVVQRTSRARLADQLSPWFVIFGYNLFCLLAVSGYFMGVTQSKEYAEAEWYADIWLVVVWVDLLRPLHPHARAAQGTAHLRRQLVLLAFILVVAILHIVNNLAVPVSFGHAKSYTVWPGVQDAMVQWWYGHNAVAFFLTAGFLGMLYYYLPVRAQRPIFSYRLSILSFWGITFFYMWAGSHHLHYTALPHWVQNLGMTFSVMLLVPVMGIGRKRAAHTERRVAPGTGRRDTPLHHDGGVLLRPVDVRRLFHGDQTCQLAVALYRLDRRTCPCGRARLGGDDHLRIAIHARAVDLETRTDVFAALVEVHFWFASDRYANLRLRHVELRHYSGAYVAHLFAGQHTRLLIRRHLLAHVPVLHRPRFRGSAVSDRGDRGELTISG